MNRFPSHHLNEGEGNSVPISVSVQGPFYGRPPPPPPLTRYPSPASGHGYSVMLQQQRILQPSIAMPAHHHQPPSGSSLPYRVVTSSTGPGNGYTPPGYFQAMRRPNIHQQYTEFQQNFYHSSGAMEAQQRQMQVNRYHPHNLRNANPVTLQRRGTAGGTGLLEQLLENRGVGVPNQHYPYGHGHPNSMGTIQQAHQSRLNQRAGAVPQPYQHVNRSMPSLHPVPLMSNGNGVRGMQIPLPAVNPTGLNGEQHRDAMKRQASNRFNKNSNRLEIILDDKIIDGEARIVTEQRMQNLKQQVDILNEAVNHQQKDLQDTEEECSKKIKDFKKTTEEFHKKCDTFKKVPMPLDENFNIVLKNQFINKNQETASNNIISNGDLDDDDDEETISLNQIKVGKPTVELVALVTTPAIDKNGIDEDEEREKSPTPELQIQLIGEEKPNSVIQQQQQHAMASENIQHGMGMFTNFDAQQQQFQEPLQLVRAASVPVGPMILPSEITQYSQHPPSPYFVDQQQHQQPPNIGGFLQQRQQSMAMGHVMQPPPPYAGPNGGNLPYFEQQQLHPRFPHGHGCGPVGQYVGSGQYFNNNGPPNFGVGPPPPRQFRYGGGIAPIMGSLPQQQPHPYQLQQQQQQQRPIIAGQQPMRGNCVNNEQQQRKQRPTEELRHFLINLVKERCVNNNEMSTTSGRKRSKLSNEEVQHQQQQQMSGGHGNGGQGQIVFCGGHLEVNQPQPSPMMNRNSTPSPKSLAVQEWLKTIEGRKFEDLRSETQDDYQTWLSLQTEKAANADADGNNNAENHAEGNGDVISKNGEDSEKEPQQQPINEFQGTASSSSKLTEILERPCFADDQNLKAIENALDCEVDEGKNEEEDDEGQLLIDEDAKIELDDDDDEVDDELLGTENFSDYLHKC